MEFRTGTDLNALVKKFLAENFYESYHSDESLCVKLAWFKPLLEDKKALYDYCHTVIEYMFPEQPEQIWNALTNTLDLDYMSKAVDDLWEDRHWESEGGGGVCTKCDNDLTSDDENGEGHRKEVGGDRYCRNCFLDLCKQMDSKDEVCIYK